MTKRNKPGALIALAFILALAGFPVSAAFARATTDFPIVKLRSLDKITARTMVFEANVGNTIKFGSVYIKVQACRKAPEMETPESAAFLQVWEITPEDKPQWIFSGWMYASSPGLSAMDHPIYDVWVLDCLEEKGKAVAETPAPEDIKEGEGEIEADQAPALPDAPPPGGGLEDQPEAPPLD